MVPSVLEIKPAGGLNSKELSVWNLIRQSVWLMAISEKVTHRRKKLLRKLLTDSDHLDEVAINNDQLDPKIPMKKARSSEFSADRAWLIWAILDSNQ